MQRLLIALGSFLALVPPSLAQQSQGPDVIVGDITGPGDYGSLGSIHAYSLGTVSCNVGNQELDWYAGSNRHPVIAQNLYRIANGRIQMIGMSWLKHGFATLNGTLCGPCRGTSGQTLGIGCSDPYGAGLNGSQTGMGPRSEVNAATGFFPWPFGGANAANLLDKRLQVAHADLQVPSAIYLAEAHYVAADDARAGNDDNNASYRRVSIASNFRMTFTAPTVRQKTAVEGWKDFDPTVNLQYVDVPGDGRFIVASKAIPGTLGRTRYEYAILNMNSDRSARRVKITLPLGANVSDLGFSDIDYHTGEPWSGTDWQVTRGGDHVSWETQTYAQNPNANALRWSTTYNFWFTSDMAPGHLMIELFKPGTPTFQVLPSPFTSRFEIIAGTSGNGDLALALAGIPSATVLGATLVSLDTNTAQGAGPVYGITPDALTTGLLSLGPQPGNPFVWTWPIAGAFPASYHEFPAGTLTSLAGMEIDMVAIGVSPTDLVGLTQVRRVGF